MARRPDDPRYEETRTQPRRGYDEPPGEARTRPDGGRTDVGRHSADTEDRERRAAPAGYGNGPAIASLVVGMISVTLAFLIFPVVAAVLLGIAAIVLGVIGLNNSNRLAGMHKGLSITGIVTGALALILGVAIIVGGATLIDDIQDIGNNIQLDELEDALNIGS